MFVQKAIVSDGNNSALYLSQEENNRQRASNKAYRRILFANEFR